MSNCCSPSGAEGSSSKTFRTTNFIHTQPTSPTRSYDQQAVGKFVEIPAGRFAMGDHHNEGYSHDGETPVHEVVLDGFHMQTTTVTNTLFENFVQATGYRTTAERFGISAVFYAAFQGQRNDIYNRVPGAPWWLAVKGADWMHPSGPESDLSKLGDHPVVHVSWDDASAYCQWAGTRLPTEAEWEYAARGGLQGKRLVWGDELTPEHMWNCNIWQGRFPHENSADDGYLTTAPVQSYRPNEYGLWQMAGNVWEWCHDRFEADYYSRSPLTNPQGPSTGTRRVLRGGSYLCHDSYCNRYRVAARSSNTPESTSGNIGFRVVSGAS
ncbi:formylglycine-generating enzyme family protein [Glutamicibacter sp. NPDC058337]